MKKKFYCYVDETGQDTDGSIFIVSVVITEEERDILLGKLEAIEKSSGKGRVKWVDARDSARVAYLKEVFSTPLFKGTMHYTLFRDTREYLRETVRATAQAISLHARGDYKVTVFVDGLPRTQTYYFGSELRQLKIKTKKLRGVRKEESNALMRLADAVCGFVRAAITGRVDFSEMFLRATKDGYIREV